MKRPKKKKLITILCISICIALSPILIFYSIMFIAVATNYTDLAQADDGFEYLLRDGIKKAGVCRYTYDPSADNGVIVIPKAYGNYPVKSLGGHMGRGGPCPFQIYINHSGNVGLSDGSFDWYITDKNLELVYYDLTLEIGPNIREIYADQGGLEVGNTLYIVRVYVNCAPNNPKFYSEDVVLYQRNGKIVEGLLYWNQDYHS